MCYLKILLCSFCACSTSFAKNADLDIEQLETMLKNKVETAEITQDDFEEIQKMIEKLKTTDTTSEAFKHLYKEIQKRIDNANAKKTNIAPVLQCNNEVNKINSVIKQLETMLEDKVETAEITQDDFEEIQQMIEKLRTTDTTSEEFKRLRKEIKKRIKNTHAKKPDVIQVLPRDNDVNVRSKTDVTPQCNTWKIGKNGDGAIDDFATDRSR